MIFSVFVAGVDNGITVIKPVKNVKDSEPQKINTGSNISCIRQVLASNKFATGGNENPMKIWDLETGKIEFTAKRVSLSYWRIVSILFCIQIRFLFTHFIF